MCKSPFMTKKNPYLSLIAIVVMVALVAVLFSGCAVETEDSPTAEQSVEKPKRFTAEYYSVDNFGGATVITDTETGEQYLFYRQGSMSGLTKLENGE